jgi:hypothetical protein
VLVPCSTPFPGHHHHPSPTQLTSTRSIWTYPAGKALSSAAASDGVAESSGGTGPPGERKSSSSWPSTMSVEPSL